MGIAPVLRKDTVQECWRGAGLPPQRRAASCKRARNACVADARSSLQQEGECQLALTVHPEWGSGTRHKLQRLTPARSQRWILRWDVSRNHCVHEALGSLKWARDAYKPTHGGVAPKFGRWLLRCYDPRCCPRRQCMQRDAGWNLEGGGRRRHLHSLLCFNELRRDAVRNGRGTHPRPGACARCANVAADLTWRHDAGYIHCGLHIHPQVLA